jgi:hypothetical protein
MSDNDTFDDLILTNPKLPRGWRLIDREQARRGAEVSPISLLTGVQKAMAARLAPEETARSRDK